MRVTSAGVAGGQSSPLVWVSKVAGTNFSGDSFDGIRRRNREQRQLNSSRDVEE